MPDTNTSKKLEKAKQLAKWQSMPYNNRELSWVDFNKRVLEEAFKKDNPIMERCNFLSITASNSCCLVTSYQYKILYGG